MRNQAGCIILLITATCSKTQKGCVREINYILITIPLEVPARYKLYKVLKESFLKIFVYVQRRRNIHSMLSVTHLRDIVF